MPLPLQFDAPDESATPPPPRRPRSRRKALRQANAQRKAANRTAAAQRRAAKRREARRHRGPVVRVLTHNLTIVAVTVIALVLLVVNLEIGKADPPPMAADDVSTNKMLELLGHAEVDPVTANAVANAKKRAHEIQVKEEKAAKVKATKQAKQRAKERARALASQKAKELAGKDTSPAQNKSIAKQMSALKGFGSCWASLETLWEHESSWNERAVNPSSGAYGIPQALPGSKLATAGSDWRTSAATQIAWGLGYIKSRYRTPCGAWAFWQRNNWY